MFAPTEYVMELADAMVETFEDDPSSVSDEKEQAYAAFAYGIYDRMTDLRYKTLQFAAEYIEGEVSKEGMLNGLGMIVAANALRKRLEFEKEELQTGRTLPDYVPDGLHRHYHYEADTAGLEPPERRAAEDGGGAGTLTVAGGGCNGEGGAPHWKDWRVAAMAMGGADNAVSPDRTAAACHADGAIESVTGGQ